VIFKEDKLKKEKSKSRFVGVRMTEKQVSDLEKAQKDSNLNKTDILLRGLELATEYYSLGMDRQPFSAELNKLATEADQYSEKLKRIKGKERAIGEMVKELRVIDEIIDKQGCDKSRLIQLLLDIQTKYNWLPRHALMWVSERLEIPLSEIYTVANFYEVLSLVPQGKHKVHVCTGTACHVRGGQQLLTRVTSVLGVQPGETDPNQRFTLKTVNCMGCCALGPVLQFDSEYISNPSNDELKKKVAGYETEEK
jgi:NADH-quinone oxidoreductase subunit E